jgi:hypothetical protein
MQTGGGHSDTQDSAMRSAVITAQGLTRRDAQAAAIADRILFLEDGRIVNDLGRTTAHEILEALEAAATGSQTAEATG